MFKIRNSQKERGSVEVVILVIVVAAIVGLVAWRIAEVQKTQIDTQAAVDTSETTPAQTGEVKVDALGLKFSVPDGNGRVSVTKPTGGDMPSVKLVSSKLKDAKSTCEGENTGVFGTLEMTDMSAGAPTPSYSKEVDGKMYGFVSSLQDNCYDNELMTAFRETVPKAIVESLEPIKKEQ